MQSGIAPWPGTTTRSAPRIEAGSEVTKTCACGATWKTHSTKPKLHLEICSNCHPFFTGKQKLLDTEGRVERFTKKYGAQTLEGRKKAAAATKAAKKPTAATR